MTDGKDKIGLDWMNCHLAPDENIISSLANPAPSLSVPWLPGPGENHDHHEAEEDDGGERDDDDEEDGGEVPEQLVVDDNGVDQVESKEPEEESRDPAGKLTRMILMFGKNDDDDETHL